MAKIKIYLPAERIIEGIASSGRKDSHGTILDPAGASWSLPLPLLDSHKPELKIGEVTEIWLDADKIGFRARVDSADIFERIQLGEKPSASVSFKKGRLETPPDGTPIHRTWTMTEISILPVGSNADAKVERAARKQRSRVIDLVSPPPAPAPAPLPVIDPMQAELARIRDRVRQIDSTIKRLQRNEEAYSRDEDQVAAIKARHFAVENRTESPVRA